MVAFLVALVGVVLVSVGLILSPAPWLALLWAGGVCVAVGLLVDFSGGDRS